MTKRLHSDHCYFVEFDTKKLGKIIVLDILENMADIFGVAELKSLLKTRQKINFSPSPI